MARTAGSGGERRRPGRPAGDSGTRDAILDAALALFAERGYDATSVRGVATAAGVDPALIRHFFGDKAGLFGETLGARSGVAQRIASAAAGPPEERGRRLAHAYLSLWRDPETGPLLLALARSSMVSEEAAAMLRASLARGIDSSLEGRPTPLSLASAQSTLAGTTLFGAAVGLHVLRLPTLTALSHDELVDLVAPSVQHHLEADGG